MSHVCNTNAMRWPSGLHAACPTMILPRSDATGPPLKRRDALELPPLIQPLRRPIEGALPRVRIKDLLMQGDAWCEFTRVLRRPDARASRLPHCSPTLLAPLIAPGTHLGIATMAHSVEGLTADRLQDMSQGCRREAILNVAHTILGNSHQPFPLSAVWGAGTGSSSDGQRCGLQASSLLGSLSPRYFGYDDQALTVDTPIADPHRVFHPHVIACSVREAIYVLDGWLNNETILRPQEHFVDQHGCTDHLFGLCHLLGFTFMPPSQREQANALQGGPHQVLWAPRCAPGRHPRLSCYGA